MSAQRPHDQLDVQLRLVDRVTLVITLIFTGGAALFLVFGGFIFPWLSEEGTLRAVLVVIPLVVFPAIWYLGVHRRVVARRRALQRGAAGSRP